MKIQFETIQVSSKTKNITVFDGEKDVIVPKKDFEKVKTVEGALPISEKCKDLNTLSIKGKNTYKVSFTEEQQSKVFIIEVPTMSFSELQSYNFEPSKKYCVHLNQDCMKNTGDYDNPLSTFLKSKENIVEAVIDSDVISIGNYAFYNCRNLQTIHLPESVNSIGIYAFEECRSLQTIHLPEGVNSIGEQAFQSCSNLQTINIPEGVTLINDYVFYDCYNLQTIHLPEGVNSIGEQAFYNCSKLQTINIPDGVTSIGKCAFYYCDSLQTITYTGTTDQWNQIEGISKASIPVDCVVHCTNGEITIQ